MKKLNLYKILFLISTILIISACTKNNNDNIQNISLTQWQNITVKKKAALMLKAKNENNSLDYTRITTLITLSPPLQPEIKNKLIAEVKRLSIHNQNLTKSANEIIKYLNSLICRKITNYTDTHNSVLKNKNSNSIIKQDVNVVKNKKTNSLNSKIIQKNELFHDSNFPTGKYLTFEKLSKLQNGKFKNTFYITGKFCVNSKFNDAYNCSLDKNKNLIEKAYDDVFDSGKKIVFEIKFPYPTAYIKKGSLLFFKQNYPLKIYAKYIIKNNDGSDYIKLRCTYHGATVHAITVAN